jgi:hypothetical protein
MYARNKKVENQKGAMKCECVPKLGKGGCKREEIWWGVIGFCTLLREGGLKLGTARTG